MTDRQPMPKVGKHDPIVLQSVFPRPILMLAMNEMSDSMIKASVRLDSQLPQETDAGYPGQPWLVEERDACGVGFIADQQGRESHDLVVKALSALTCLEHRGGCSADQDSGDGAGLMTAIACNKSSAFSDAHRA